MGREFVDVHVKLIACNEGKEAPLVSGEVTLLLDRQTFFHVRFDEDVPRSI